VVVSGYEKLVRLVAVAGVVVGLLAGCSAVYDAQYEDRENQLAQSRRTFLTGTTNVQFLSAGEHRVYWVDVPQTVEMPELHSVAEPGSAQVDYPWSEDLSTAAAAGLGLGDQLVVSCSNGQAFDAGASEPASPYGQLDTSVFAGNENVGTLCVVSGGAAYFVSPNAPPGIEEWQPVAGSATTTQALALGSINPNPNGFGFADAGHILYQEGNNVWLLPLSGALPESPLEGQQNEVTAGTIAFDDEGVAYVETAGDVVYLRYSDATFDPAPVTSVASLISASGYRINFEHADVQNLAPNGAYVMFQHHLVYEGNGGIFALGMDTGNVVDLLLDGLADSDGNQSPLYKNPVITDDGTLFVQDQSLANAANVQPVYAVDLNGRLR